MQFNAFRISSNLQSLQIYILIFLLPPGGIGWSISQSSEMHILFARGEPSPLESAGNCITVLNFRTLERRSIF